MRFVGTPHRLRCPVSWVVLDGDACLVPAWGKGGRVCAWLWSCLLFVARASEILAESSAAVHVVHGLRRGDVACFLGIGAAAAGAVAFG